MKAFALGLILACGLFGCTNTLNGIAADWTADTNAIANSGSGTQKTN